ncbi:MAG: potassium channel family protein [Myxococcales bacterium]|nr:potassium channel family protein [Myxococcales bacterium]
MTRIDIYRPLKRSGLLVALAFLVGLVGYLVIGSRQYGWIDALYMTVITLTTVGYSEVIDLSGSPGGRLFTAALLLGGVGALLYFFSAVTAFFVEGHVQRLLWRRKMSKAIQHLSGHTIVCGGGHTGQHIVQELLATERPFVLIDVDESRVDALMQRLGCEFLVVIGDARDDDALHAAGIERAAGLVASISNDKDNLIVTVSARLLRPDLRIVCRCIDERIEEKILKAGADSVVSPNRIGGLRMISETVRPTAVSYLDIMLRDPDSKLRVESTLVLPRSRLADSTVGDLRGREIGDLLIVALRKPDEQWVFAPSDEHPLAAGGSVVYMGSAQAREAVEGLARPGD